MEIDENVGWNVHSNGGTFSITTEEGDIIADDIPHHELAHYIARMHNVEVRAKRNFRQVTLNEIPRDNGLRSRQCDATVIGYRCVHGLQHTGPHVTYGIGRDYLFD